MPSISQYYNGNTSYKKSLAALRKLTIDEYISQNDKLPDVDLQPN
ncbi:hypothetical protein TGAMA5MH_00243 [Trichoderma gamsii]|uniref:Uncharacterized protein n=1 Tax=Trichoderma gamsii TaxID=398673 RepID=A0A2K0TTD3_9HYPO|nr:hypothetical protein TGAMA5MH_00243 [Trichoderma gamsii]